MRLRAALTTLTALAATGVLALGAGAPAVAKDSPPGADGHSVKTSSYVALGDSYAAGAGVAPFVPGSPAGCSRSQANFAEDLAAQLQPAAFTDATCSGAQTKDYFTSQLPGVAPQLDAVTRHTRFVTMTIGGNDGGVFGGLINGCTALAFQQYVATGSIFGDPCAQAFGSSFDATIDAVTYPNLVHALSAVRARAPRATVVILGYPTIMPATGVPACFSAMPIAMGDVPYLHGIQEHLNAVVERAARRTGARFVDMAPASEGHDACAGADRWIEPAVGPVNAAPVHPNATGEAAMADQVLAQVVSRHHADHEHHADHH